ncbi:Holliday junction branch migration DNA helicase RuvB [Candidatus Sumerlaeota bacterium]|nr:Holliday junction branch migration DNA helicase RuvB [Candidatus Sumerlaeota bacterium]
MPDSSSNPHAEYLRPQKLSEEAGVETALRPQSLSDFVGQHEFLERIQIAIEAARKREEPLQHVLLYGPPGLGKTTMARIIANELGVGFRQYQGSSLDRKDTLAAILTEVNHGDVIFIDEIHRLNPAVEECLYPAIEDFEFHIVIGDGPHGRSVKLELEKFTMVGATTRAGMITAPLRDRFPIVERLRFYTPEELAVIVRRTAGIMNIGIDEEGAVEIARRCRATPRIANRLVSRVRDYAEVRADGRITRQVAEQAFEMYGVDSAGLEPVDRLYLRTIIEKFKGGPVGQNSIAVAISEDEDTILDYIEPFLIQTGFIKRTAQGRVVTETGFRHMGFKPTGDPQGAQGEFI